MDFKQKTRFLSGGHLTDTHQAVTYPSVVLRDNVIIILTIATLNYLGLRLFNIGKLIPQCINIWEGTLYSRDWILTRTCRKITVIVQALYELIYSGDYFIIIFNKDEETGFQSKYGGSGYMDETTS